MLCEQLKPTSARKLHSEEYGSRWSLNVNSGQGRHQKVGQVSRQYSITNENLLKPSHGCVNLALQTKYEILCPGIDLIFADMCPGNYNAMPVDMNDSYVGSNTAAPRAPIIKTSIITLSHFRSNEWHVYFHAEKNSILPRESLQSVFDDPSHFHLSHRRRSPSQMQRLRAKIYKIPTTDALQSSIA